MNTRRMNGDTLEIIYGNDVVFSLSEKLINNEMNIAVIGSINNEVAHEFEDELMAAFSVCNTVRLDLSKVSYIASIAMRALLSVQQIIDEKDDAFLIITKMSSKVKEMFEETGFLDILNIEE